MENRVFRYTDSGSAPILWVVGVKLIIFQASPCPSSKKLRFSSLDGLRPIIRSGKSSAYVQAQRICFS